MFSYLILLRGVIMESVVIAVSLILLICIGYFLIKRLDSFLDENSKNINKDKDDNSKK